MAQTTESASTETTTTKNKEGVQIKGKDVILLNAPEVFLSPDTPLLTKAQDIANAINELKKELDEGGGDEEWQPPESWIPVPEPGDYEMYFLVEITNAPNEYLRLNVNYPEGYIGDETLIIDWGNGEISDYSGKSYIWFAYTYPENGQFLVKVTLSKTNCHFIGISNSPTFQPAKILIAKLGSKILLNCENSYGDGYRFGFYNQQYLYYVKINGSDGLPPFQIGSTYAGAFTSCYRLKRVDMAVPATVIPVRCFFGCHTLGNFDFSEVTEIKSEAFAHCGFKKIVLPKCASLSEAGKIFNQYRIVEFSAPLIEELSSSYFYNCPNLKKVNVPKCSVIGNECFENCYNLTDISVAENCSFGTSCFTNCYSLYDIPGET